MGSFYKAAATVCLLAFCGLQSEAAKVKKYKFTVKEVNEDDYIYANFVRNGKLPTHISEVAKDQDLVDSLKTEVGKQETSGADATCEALIKASNFKTMFHHPFEDNDDASPDYRQLLQNALDAGLAVFRGTDSTGAGATSKNNAVLFCELKPAAEKNSAPFDEEYFNGLIGRTAKLAEMTADDLKAPVEESAATTAGPTILIASLVAMLAAASA
ncbi:hypothetical protein EBH_0045900 [Eimeria brunetti]|uniref:SAG family member n=1 Tax=Eimeria brunetti TaxID=51314 RepID=U6LVB9_9EIME|nr:hypothetical protein EBH_0045900 [Eimeria brunetti]